VFAIVLRISSSVVVE